MAKQIIILAKYLNFAKKILKKLAAKLFEHSDINKYSINLKPDKQPFYSSIYKIKLVKLKIIKLYIKTNPANNFIRSLKSFVKTPIFFVQKSNCNFHLCVNY